MMRTFLILLIAVCSFGTLLHAQNASMDMATKREIPVKGKNEGSEDDMSQRAPVYSPVQAFIEGEELLIEFYELPCTVEVNITNLQTGEVLYSEACIAVDDLVVNLEGLVSGEYRLEFSLNAKVDISYGDFIF